MNKEINNDFFERKKKEFGIELNETQKEAVLHKEGPLLLLAVPGSGKTTTMIMNINYLIENNIYQSNRILALTFSKESANDMGERYKYFAGSNFVGMPRFSTIHSFAYSITKDYLNQLQVPHMILMGWEQEKLMMDSIETIVGSRVKDDKEILQEFALAVTLIKNKMSTQNEIENMQIEGFSNGELARAFTVYEERKQSYKGLLALDFDDMLIYAKKALENDKTIFERYTGAYDYILVDESQDTSKIQHDLIDLLVKPHNNVFMVGDDDQSIYLFRAADVDSILDFEKRYPTTKKLFMEQNYRSSKEVVWVANEFIKKNKTRYAKNMFTENEHASKIRRLEENTYMEAFEMIIEDIIGNNKKDNAILYRNSGNELPLLHLLHKKKQKFYIKKVDNKLFKNFMVTDIEKIINFSHNYHQAESWFDVASVKGGVKLFLNKKHQLELNEKIEQAEEGESFFDIISQLSLDTWRINNMLELEYQLMELRSIKTLAEQIQYILYEMDYIEHLDNYLNFINKDPSTYIDILISLMEITREMKNVVELKDYLDKLSKLSVEPNGDDEVIHILTLHSSKGLEYENVYMLLPPYNSMNTESVKLKEEESRLHYVGITRAKKNLTVINIKTEKISNDAKDLISLINQVNSNGFQKKLRTKGESEEKKTTEITTEAKTEKHIEKKESETTFSVGEYVKHKTLGFGQILSNENEQLEIKFAGKGSKVFSLPVVLKSKLLARVEIHE